MNLPGWYLQIVGGKSKLTDNHDKPHTFNIIKEGIEANKTDEEILKEIETYFGKVKSNDNRRELIRFQRRLANPIEVEPMYPYIKLTFNGIQLQNKIILAKKAILMAESGDSSRDIAIELNVSESWIKSITPEYIEDEERRLKDYIKKEDNSIRVRIPIEKDKKAIWEFSEEEIREIEGLNNRQAEIRIGAPKGSIKLLRKKLERRKPT
jgi:spermidine/putrescine-binding protein